MQTRLWEMPMLAVPGSCSRRFVAREAALLVGYSAIAVLLVRSGVERALLSEDETSLVLAVAAGAAAIAMAVMWWVLARISDDGRAALCAGAFAIYGLIAVPATSLGSMVEARPVFGAIRLAAHAVFVGLLLGGTMSSAETWRTGARKLIAAGVLIVVTAGVFAVLQPASLLLQ